VELAGGLATLSGGNGQRASAENGSESTPAEDEDRAILRLLTEGQSNREMAESLGISESAVAQRLARVLGRLGASSRAEATSLAFRGLTRPSSLNAATKTDPRLATGASAGRS
jgi:DNA-binding NarL/FixJ family response regulator